MIRIVIGACLLLYCTLISIMCVTMLLGWVETPNNLDPLGGLFVHLIVFGFPGGALILWGWRARKRRKKLLNETATESPGDLLVRINPVAQWWCRTLHHWTTSPHLLLLLVCAGPPGWITIPVGFWLANRRVENLVKLARTHADSGRGNEAIPYAKAALYINEFDKKAQRIVRDETQAETEMSDAVVVAEAVGTKSDDGADAKDKPIGSRDADAAADGDIFGQLKKLAELRDSGVLTIDEFERKKQELLSRM